MITNDAKYSINDLAPLICECINAGKKIKLRVTGNSMYPLFYNRRDIVELEKISEVHKYDIVLHKRKNGKYILHRVIKKKGNILTIAGDFEVEKEYPVDVSQVIARVSGFWRKGKYYSAKSFVYKMYSRFWVMVMPFRYEILNFLHSARRKIYEKK